MCVQATTALTIASVVGQAISFQQQKKQQQYAWWQQKKQNELARENAIQRYASEQLKIRQTLKQASQKDLEATLKARRARARFITEAGDAGGLALSGSTTALLANYYRTEGNYKTALQNNMNVNISQFERNLEAIQFGQKSQTTYEVPPNPNLLFATHALNVANTYWSLESQKEMKGLMTNAEKRRQKKLAKRYEGYS